MLTVQVYPNPDGLTSAEWTDAHLLNPLLRLFGATPLLLSYAREYLSVILAGSVFITFAMATNNIVRAEGRATVAMVTDYDVWKEKPVDVEQVLKTVAENLENVRNLVGKVVPRIPEDDGCGCQSALYGARF